MAKKATPANEYHKWYYDTSVWLDVKFLGVPCYKSVSDMWNYQEVMVEMKPVMEFGTCFGRSHYPND